MRKKTGPEGDERGERVWYDVERILTADVEG